LWLRINYLFMVVTMTLWRDTLNDGLLIARQERLKVLTTK